MKSGILHGTAVLAAALLLPATTVAQRLGTVELMGLGRYTWMSKDRPIDNTIGVGGGFGFYLSNRVKLLANVSYSPGESTIDGSDVGYVPLHIRLAYELPLAEKVRAVLGTGYVLNHYPDDGSADNGLGSLVGLRYLMSEKIALFAQFTHDWMPPALNPKTYYIVSPPGWRWTVNPAADVHHGFEVGLAARLGGGAAPAVVAIAEPVRTATDRVQPQQQTPPPAQQPPPAQTPPPVQTPPPAEKAATPAPPERFVTLEPVYFDFDKSELRPAAREQLERVAVILRANPDAVVTVEGHADRRGTSQYNIALGLRRAAAVRAFLQERGIDASRLQQESQGAARPVDDHNTEDAHQRNRRVEFRLPTSTQLRDPGQP